MNAPSPLLDIDSPDHVLITSQRDTVTVIVTKEGKSITLNFPSIQPTTTPSSYKKRAIKRVSQYFRVKHKLTASQVREIKLMISDPEITSRFNTITKAYESIGKVYNVTGTAISNIAHGHAWKHITI